MRVLSRLSGRARLSLGAGVIALAAIGAVAVAQAVSGPRFFDTDCNFLDDFSAPIDPLLHPGDDGGGASHTHEFFGSKGISADSDGQQLVEFNSQTGEHEFDGLNNFSNETTSCRIEDDSESGAKRKDGAAYWVPALARCDDPTGLNNSCDASILEPLSMHIYYRSEGTCDDGQGVCDGPEDGAFTETPRAGFAFIAGNESVIPNGQSEPVDTHRVGSIDWLCSSDDNGTRYPTADGILDEPGDFCQGGKKLIVTIHGPECWDGVTPFPEVSGEEMMLDGMSDHVGENAPCSQYGENWVRIPRLNMQIFYDDSVLGSEDDGKNFYMAHTRVTETGGQYNNWDTTAFAHFDFLNAWDTTDADADGKMMLDRLVDGCLNSRSLDHPHPGDNDCNE